MKYLKKFNENVNTPEIENELVNFFENFTMDKQWVIDRFNDDETKKFISYMENILPNK